MSSGNSTDGTMRGFAPACLREPYLRMVGGSRVEDRALPYALAFVEAGLRFLTALLAPEGAERDRPEAFSDLLAALHNPSMGHWHSAADALARRVLGQPDAIARPAALALRSEKGKATAAFRAFGAWIQMRNDCAHDPRRPLDTTSPKALAWFEDVGRGQLVEIVQSFDFVREMPLFWVGRSGSGGVVLHRLLGLDDQDFPHPGVLDIPVEEVLLVGADGRAVTLGPFLVRTADDPTSPPCLLQRRDARKAQAAYLHPYTGGPIEMSWRESPPRRLALDATAVAAAEVNPPGLLGSLIAGYRAAYLINRGATSAIYASTAPSGQAVALKVLHPAHRFNHRQRRRQRREFEVLQSLDHPAIVRVIEVLQDPDHGTVIVMERAPGVDLQRTFVTGPARLKDGLRVVEAVLDALDHMHARHVIHRDVKPANVILDGTTVKLVDFGIALDDQAARLTGTRERLGTVEFAAPEQLSGDVVGPATDLFGVGRLAAWIFTGKTDPTEALSRLPSGLAGFVRRATRRLPEERFQSADEMRSDLRQRVAQGLDFGEPVAPGDTVSGLFRLTHPAVRLKGSTWSALAHDEHGAIRLWFAASGVEDGRRLRALVKRQHRGRRASGEWEGLYFAAYAPEVVMDGLPPPPPDEEAPRTGADASLGERSGRRAGPTPSAVRRPAPQRSVARPLPQAIPVGPPASSPVTASAGAGDADLLQLGFQIALDEDLGASPIEGASRLAAVPVLLARDGVFGGARAPEAAPGATLRALLAVDLLLLRMAATRTVLGSLGLASWFTDLTSGPTIWERPQREQLAAIGALLGRAHGVAAHRAARTLTDLAGRSAAELRPAIAYFTAGLLAGLPARALYPVLHVGRAGWQVIVDARPGDGALVLEPGQGRAPILGRLRSESRHAWLNACLWRSTGLVKTSGDDELRWVHDQRGVPVASACFTADVTGDAGQHPTIVDLMSSLAARGVRMLCLTDGRWCRWLKRSGTSISDVERPRAQAGGHREQEQ